MNAFPIDRVRREFPVLSQSRSGIARIFMDNPGGTQLPRQVIDAISNALVDAASNYGGFFENSRNAEAIYARAHDAMADFLNAHSPNEIVVAQGMTSLTLHMSRSLGRIFAPGDEVGERVPTVSMTHNRVSPARVAERLARDEICVWSGHNYAFEVVKSLAIDEETGVVRIGLAHYNTEVEVDKTLTALEHALK